MLTAIKKLKIWAQKNWDWIFYLWKGRNWRQEILSEDEQKARQKSFCQNSLNVELIRKLRKNKLKFRYLSTGTTRYICIFCRRSNTNKRNAFYSIKLTYWFSYYFCFQNFILPSLQSQTQCHPHQKCCGDCAIFSRLKKWLDTASIVAARRTAHANNFAASAVGIKKRKSEKEKKKSCKLKSASHRFSPTTFRLFFFFTFVA